jgi:hypothetical protein
MPPPKGAEPSQIEAKYEPAPERSAAFMKMRIASAFAALSIGLAAPAFAEGPTPADIEAFRAAINRMPGSGNVNERTFADGIHSVGDVVLNVALRDHPELAQPYRACQAQMYSNDGGITYPVVPQYRAYCDNVMAGLKQIVKRDFDILLQATSGN